MWVIADYLRPAGHIMPDHAGDRGVARLDLCASRSPTYQPDEHAQTSVTEHGDRHCPRPAGGPDGAEAARRVAQAGRATIRRRSPSSRGRGTEGLCLRAASSHSGHLRGIGPEPGTWKDPGPRRRSRRGSGGSEEACLPGNGGYATPAACPVSTTSWRYGLRRTFRLVAGTPHRPRSTWPNQAR
jgi:hypothetical protein